jgi:hypothetical protein
LFDWVVRFDSPCVRAVVLPQLYCFVPLTRECSQALPSTTKMEFWIRSRSINLRRSPRSHFSKSVERIVFKFSGSMVKTSVLKNGAVAS